MNILHLYPDLMNLYGDSGNLRALERRLRDQGEEVTIDRLDPGQVPDFMGYDLIYMGPGTERSQKAALALLRPHGEALRAAMEKGVHGLFTGNASSMLGKDVVDGTGKVWPGLGLLDFTAREKDERYTGDAIVRHPSLSEQVRELGGTRWPSVPDGHGPGRLSRRERRRVSCPQLPGHPPHRPGAGEEPPFPQLAAEAPAGPGLETRGLPQRGESLRGHLAGPSGADWEGIAKGAFPEREGNPAEGSVSETFRGILLSGFFWFSRFLQLLVLACRDPVTAPAPYSSPAYENPAPIGS